MCQCMECPQVRIGNILSDTSQCILENLKKLLKTESIKAMFCVSHKKICKDCDYRYICGGKCAATEDTYDYRCIFLKAMLNYTLFHYDYRKGIRENLEEYIIYMEHIKRTEMEKSS